MFNFEVYNYGSSGLSVLLLLSGFATKSIAPMLIRVRGSKDPRVRVKDVSLFYDQQELKAFHPGIEC